VTGVDRSTGDRHAAVPIGAVAAARRAGSDTAVDALAAARPDTADPSEARP
jgi:hypothetical protein